MSRCFPFPPPGYEKKARPDDADLLKKEKQKEKKHKKEKRDKEKKEGKEKREKDRSDGKHREKKDKKEKHKDKKKDKEKDKDKEKSSTSEEKRVAGQFEGHNGEKLHQEERGKEKISISKETRVTGQFEGCNGDKPNQKVDRVKDLQFQCENPIRNQSLSEETKDSKFVLELGRRIKDDEKGRASQLVEGFQGADWRKDEGIERLAVKDAGMLVEVQEKNKDKRVDNRKMGEATFSGNAMVQNHAGIVQKKAEGMPGPTEKKIEKRMEGKEKSKEKEGEEKRGDKRKNKDREKQNQGKDRDREKAKKEEKAKEKSEHKKTEKEKIKHSNKNDPIGGLNSKTSHLSMGCDRNAAIVGNIKKRKEIDTNGFLHDNEPRPIKMPRIAPNLSTENGKKLEPYQTPSSFTSDRQGADNNLPVDNIGHKVNGTKASQPLSLPQTKPSSATAKASTKPPHPDTKYLSQVLSVPKIEWSDFDEQDWLFSSKDSSLKKPYAGSSGLSEEPQVWAEALQIDSADVCALPYVIPF